MSATVPSGEAAATSGYLLDRSFATLREAAPRWARRSIDTRLADLARIAERTAEVAPDLVADSLRAKGVGRGFEGEEWLAGPYSVLRTIRFLHQSMRGIARRGAVPLRDGAIRERPDGQVVVDVMPADPWDRVLYSGWRASVRLDPEVPRSGALRSMGAIYADARVAEPGVAVVLGAGNVSSIVPLDLIHKLFVEGQVVLAKFNPVNDYIGPYVEHAFADLIAQGFVRTAYGGVAVGEHLVTHPEVDSVHITGSAESHDAIVFGSGAAGVERKSRNEPRIRVPVTSELGNVSPVVVVPGTWSARQVWYQAGHVATQLVHNAGYNCNAAKVLALPGGWPQRDEFLDAVRARLSSVPPRPAYYPGSAERYRSLLDAGGEPEPFGEAGQEVPPTILHLDPGADHPALSTEAFCRMLAHIDLPGDEPATFLQGAVDFCNDRLGGTLNATLIIDPATLRQDRGAVDLAVDRLRYGTIGVNVWGAAGFPLGVTPWGAYPGHTLDDIGSGIGFVHNARLIDHPQKTVVSAPFVPLPQPPFSVFHRRAGVALRHSTAFEAKPSLWRLAWIAAQTVAGHRR